VTERPEFADVEAVAERRDDLVAAVRDHAGEIAADLARLQGGDYGQETFETGTGEWTLKHEAGELAYLRFDPGRGATVYVVSTKREPEPEPLATALADYDAFVRAVDDYVTSLSGVFDGVDPEFPTPASTAPVVEERARILARVREVCDHMAGELDRVGSESYGTFTARLAGTRWELKYERDRASYLRIGGADGVYLLSQYGPPAATDVREYAPRFRDFVAAYNDHVAELERDLATVEF
jgi:hypothetical protein